MKINNNDVSIEDLIKTDLHNNLHQLFGKDIYISNSDIDILKKYDFDINKYNDIKTLILDISDYLDNNYDMELDDLESVVNSLSEFNYYQNTNK